MSPSLVGLLQSSSPVSVSATLSAMIDQVSELIDTHQQRHVDFQRRMQESKTGHLEEAVQGAVDRGSSVREGVLDLLSDQDLLLQMRALLLLLLPAVARLNRDKGTAEEVGRVLMASRRAALEDAVKEIFTSSSAPSVMDSSANLHKVSMDLLALVSSHPPPPNLSCLEVPKLILSHHALASVEPKATDRPRLVLVPSFDLNPTSITTLSSTQKLKWWTALAIPCSLIDNRSPLSRFVTRIVTSPTTQIIVLYLDAPSIGVVEADKIVQWERGMPNDDELGITDQLKRTEGWKNAELLQEGNMPMHYQWRTFRKVFKMFI